MGSSENRFVWLSKAPKNLEAMRAYYSTDVETEDQVEAFKKKYWRNIELSSEGKILPKDAFPQDVYLPACVEHYGSKKITPFMGGNFQMISSKTEAIFRNFNLGNVQLIPVNIWNQDRTKIVELAYYLTVPNIKNSISLEKSTGLEELLDKSGRYDTYDVCEDDELVLSKEALGGACIWREPKIYGAYFLDDKLVQSMIKAKVTKNWDLFRCVIAD